MSPINSAWDPLIDTFQWRWKLVKEVVGPMHRQTSHVMERFSVNNKKKEEEEENANAQVEEMQSKRILNR